MLAKCINNIKYMLRLSYLLGPIPKAVRISGISIELSCNYVDSMYCIWNVFLTSQFMMEVSGSQTILFFADFAESRFRQYFLQVFC